ncbi:DNA/RNA helicase [Sinomonas atrocyanea]|uniref:DNA/RNA helicase n=1 Tax=Sinomonas atrocyanea TaxID=37927 RepID=A0A126ZXW8_9MICC|nr:DEAD/DEAH box helicase [Sinomonas atrocyanea]AMM32018.1 DNA/RNA helicase [Sinomonas atrocyanea]GEB65189.1 DNA helicase [Sinomonas atrocyanea]GGG69337.1 DNA helicase [Sinomonas atrocyanea]
MTPLSLAGQHPGTGGGALPLVDVAGMVARIGAAAMSRAHAYARDGRVENLAWHPDISEMTAQVFGTAEEPYEVGVYLKPQQATYRYAGGWCTCPIAADCKHIGAVVLAANTQRLRAEASQQSAARTAEPAWKGELRRIINPAGERHVHGRSGRLGLQFELRDVEARLGGRFARSGARRRGEHRLGMRPVEYNPATGRWLRGDLSWSRFGRPDHVGDFYTPHFELLRELQALRLGTGSGYWNGNDPWLYLDEFTSPLLWTLLGAAAPLGLELVAARRGTGVTLADGTAAVGLEALPGEDDPAALRLVPTLAVDGVALPMERAGTIADHGAYAIVRTGADGELIILAQSESRLGERERALLGTPGGVEIPAADRESFLAEFYPDLARSVTITADDAVDLPPVEPPLLVLTASFGPRDELRLAWHWEYPTGDAVRQLPLAAVPGEGLHRDEAAEEGTLQRVAEALADSPLAGALVGPARLEDLDTADFAERTLPALERLDGVAVRIEGTKPDYRRLEGAPQLVLSAVESEKNDWFDLGLMVKIEDRSIPFQDIFTALARGRDKVLMPDKTWFRIDTPEIRRLKRIIDESHELREWRIEGPPAKRPPRLSVYQAGLWDEISELAGETVEPARWKQTVEGLLDPRALDPVPVPGGLAATLRPYQDEGFQWLAFLHRHGLGGVLADDMGLGKTLQTLALILHARDTAPAPQPGAAEPDAAAKPPFLVLAPTSVVPNWEAEAGRFAPGLRTVALTDTQGKSGTPVAASADGADIVVTSYALFRLDFEAYAALDWSGLIMDEAQFLKNRATKVHQCARDLETPFKLALTGTPLENNLMELWSLFAIVSPGLFPAASHFAQDFARPIEKGGDADRLARLRRRVRPLMLRRTKEAVATELPEKFEQRLDVELSPKHRSLYQQYLQREREKVLGLVEDLDRHRFIVFRSLTLLRLMALDPALVDDSHEGVMPAKLDALLEQLDDVVAEGHRALVFSQFTSFLKKAAERLDAAGIAYEYLDGSTRRRGEVVSRFKEGEAPVFLISLKAGGFGLNLTEADYCFLLDPWWNPAAEAQAVDRAHRIGQSRRVMTYRLVAKGTIEEKVMELKEKKAALFSSVVDDDAMFSSSLTAEDVRGLLA